MEKEIVSKNQLISSLIRIGHGNYGIFRDIGIKASLEQPELFAHFISWNNKKGKVRDSKVAFPVCALRSNDNTFDENAVANLCMVSPKDLINAMDFHQMLNDQGHTLSNGSGGMLKTGIKLYIKARMSGKLGERAMLQHRKSMKNLLKAYHVKPSKLAQAVLFDGKYPKGSIFEAVAELKNMTPKEAAGTILNRDIPYLIAVGALGGIKDKPDIILALIEQMSGTELINQTNSLTRMGVFENPVLTSAYDAAIEQAKKDKKTSTLKSGIVKTTSKKAAVKLKGLKDEKLAQLGGIEGDWLILGDKSTSMNMSIEISKMVSGLLAQQIKGNVYLVFFNSDPQYMNVTGKTIDEITAMTKNVRSSGMTSIGVGLDYIMHKGHIVNGIIIVSDGGDNTRPRFYSAYADYVAKMGIEPTVYHIKVKGSCSDVLLSPSKCLIEKIVFGKDVDYNSLPNLVMSLKANRYQFVDEVMETPLLTFKDVFERRV